MKNIRLTLILMAVAVGLNLRAQAPTPGPATPATPDAAAILKERMAFEAARAAAAATNTGRLVPGAATLPSAATRPAPPAFPAFPPPPGAATGAAGATTNRGNIRFTPLNQPVAPVAPNVAGAVGAAGAAGAAGATTNVTLAAIRAASTNAANAANAAAQPEEVFPPGLLKFSEADINPILDIYQELTGRTVLKAPSLPAAKITFKTQTPLTRSEAIGALETVLAMNQITMVPQGTKFVKAVPQAQAFQEAKAFDSTGSTNDMSWELYPESATMVTHVVQLKNALPNEMVQILQPFAKMPQSILTLPSTSMLIIRDYSENAKRMLELIEKLDVVPQQDFIDVVIPIKYALAADIQQVLSTLTAGGGGGGTTVGRSTANTGLSTGGGSGFGGRGGLGGGGLPGSPGYNPANPYGGAAGGLGGAGGGLGGAGGAGGRSSFAQRLNSIVSRASQPGGGDIFVLGQTKIIADERTNSLLIFASRQDLMTISNIIDKLDVVLAQVVIEAVIIEVALNHNLNFGISAVQTQPTSIGNGFGAGAIRSIPFLGLNNIIGGGTASNTIGEGFTYAASFMNFDAAVTAIAGDGRGKILQRPRIQTSHAVEANLFVGQSRPYPSSSSSGGIYGGYNQIQQLQIGVTLSVLPLINHDGLVVMDIRQKIESYDGDVIIQSVGAVPITSQKEANAKVSVRDRETVLLGGFISNQKTKSHGGVPILKDIPILGALFRSNQEMDDRKELIVLIRPTVLPTPDIAANFAKDARAQMPGTKEAEADFTEAEEKLLNDTNKRMHKKSDIYKKEGFTK